MPSEKDRELIQQFKTQYKFRADCLQQLRDLEDPISEIQNRMENYKSPAPHNNTGRVSAKEADNDARMLALIEQKTKLEEHDGPRIQMLQRMIADLDVSVWLQSMPFWSQYVLDRVYRQGATFEEVSRERRDCRYTRRHLMRRLDYEILKAIKNTR